MKKISIWARDHKWPARIIIVFSILLLNVIGIYTGILLNDSGIKISVSLLFFFAILYAIGFISYPSKKNKEKKHSASAFYIRQKSCDFLLAFSTFCMFIYMGNHPGQFFQHNLAFNSAKATSFSFPKDSSVKSYKPINEFLASMKDANGNTLKWKERKLLLKEQVRAIKHSSEISNGNKTLLIILSVIAAILLIGLVASLACSLSCAGSEVAAFILGFGGTALIIWLLVVVIRKISRKKMKEPEKPQPES